ncbi:MAG: putative photosynthetic complex assembly protein PuhE [Myxococcota bacterium]
MAELAPPALFALVAWWLSTGAIFFFNGLSRWTHRWSLCLVTMLAALSLWGLYALADVASPAAAYLAFVFALAVWGAHEMAFLLGSITGPVRTPCPPQVSGSRRFLLATGSVIYHELALAVTLIVIAGLTRGGSNRVGFWTFVVLWVMRLSAKFNLYLGVRNVTHELMPEHMRYLSTYFGKPDRNPLMPASVLGALGAVLWLGSVAVAARGDSFVATGTMLVATLLALALLEHLFLAFPVRDAVLWQWAIDLPEASDSDTTGEIVALPDEVTLPPSAEPRAAQL